MNTKIEETKPLVKGEEYLNRLNWRYAVKKFDPTRKISTSDWNVLAESLRLSPSSYGLQPWKFIVVQSESLRQQLVEQSWGQKQVVDCSHFVVLTTLKKMDEAYVARHVENTARIRGLPVESFKGYFDSMVGDVVKGERSKFIPQWSQRQAYIAMGNLMTTAALLGVDACPMEGLVPAKYDQILNLENTNYATVAAVALGYRHPEDHFAQALKSRFAMSDVIEIR